MPSHNVQRLKADIKVLENEHRAERKELRLAQQKLAAFDADKNEKKWSDRYPLCDRIGSLIQSTTSRKDDLTELYQARAHLRGRLHMQKTTTGFREDGTRETEAWSLDAQEVVARRVLKNYEIPDVDAGEAAA
jgi:hypothetical protein